jgi:cell wall-associated NlpC family hydrolase
VSSQIRLILLVLVLVYVAAFGPGRASASGSGAKSASRSSGVGLRVTRFARHLLGIPYRYGGSTPSTGFDCSGFVRFVYSHFGVTLPHSTYADFDLGTPISRNSLRPGDLVFFDSVGHVGLYIGNGRFIHAPHTGLRVMVSSLSESWYATRYDGARRLAVKVAHRVLPAKPTSLAPLARWLTQARS